MLVEIFLLQFFSLADRELLVEVFSDRQVVKEFAQRDSLELFEQGVEWISESDSPSANIDDKLACTDEYPHLAQSLANRETQNYLQYRVGDAGYRSFSSHVNKGCILLFSLLRN